MKYTTHKLTPEQKEYLMTAHKRPYLHDILLRRLYVKATNQKSLSFTHR